jgi:hypothetical protein
MPRALRILVVMLLAALLPLRAVAAVTTGFCGAAHHDAATQAHAHHGHGAEHHHGHDSRPAKPACNMCVEHCSSAALAPSGDRTALVTISPAARFLHAERVAPAFVPDQLDRPPLA